MMLKKIINIGKSEIQGTDFKKIRLVNLIGCITVFVSFAYLIFYIYVQATEAIWINSAVIVCYGLTFLFNHLGWYRLAKNWIYSVYMIHLFVLTTFIFTKATGFHFYYFAVPLTLFLVFDYKEVIDKTLLTIISVILFYVCELYRFHAPYILLSHTTNRVLFLSSLLTILSGIVFVVALYTTDIKRRETAREEMIDQLKKAVNEIHQLRGILPICAYCKKIRDDKGYWSQIESYIQNHSAAEFSHGICPDCAERLYPDMDLYEDEDLRVSG